MDDETIKYYPEEPKAKYLFSVWAVWEMPRKKDCKTEIVEAESVQDAMDQVIGKSTEGIIIADVRRIAPSSYVAICKRQEGSRYDYTGIKE